MSPAESHFISSRPLSYFERSWLVSRGIHGTTDALPLITLGCSPATPIADNDVVLAWSVLRLRHPILTSRISPQGSLPELISTSARTASQAIEQAGARIEFSIFDDRDQAIEALRMQWEGPNPTRVVDIHQDMHVIWQKDATGSLGHYVFGMQTVHYQLDARRRLDVMHQFAELLSAPWVAQEELDAHFSLVLKTSLRIPMSIESNFPGLVVDADDPEQRRGQEVYERLMGGAAVPPCGLRYDGPVDAHDIAVRTMRHVFPQSTTAHIMRACRAQNVTVTRLYQAAWILAAIEVGREQFGDADESRNGLPVHDGSYHFSFALPLDLVQYTKTQPIAAPNDLDVSLKIVWSPSLISIPHSLSVGQDADVLLWDVARRAKAGHAALTQSPFFWPVIARFQAFVESVLIDQSPETALPFMPLLSSIGDVSNVLPSRIIARPGRNSHGGSSNPKDIRVTDMYIFVKVPAICGLSHVWTFDGRMTVQLIHNGRSVSPALGDKYFGRVVDILARIGQA
ncbi:hypothetical protein B0H21DRAFT_825518 [Amylocystis lapponica]|nr:hypothetical protein B0H21DRAFT_825518 [Amylocystis lapponica]